MTRMRHIWNITFTGFLAGSLYTLLADDLRDPAPVINALLIGTIGGFFAGIIEFYLFQPRIKRPEFAKSVFLKVITYFFMLVFLVVFVKGNVDSFFNDTSFTDYLSSPEFVHFVVYGEMKIILLYAFTMIFFIIFTMQVSKFLGKGVLWNIITGKYHSPRYENRILLLVDMTGSTTIAERLDPVLYYKLLDRFFFDVNAGARKYGGAIYRYVGDQVTITWPVGTRNENANCVRAFFSIHHQMKLQRELYLNEFGFVPEFKGTAHSGQLVSGEIGDIRSQIVYYGLPLLEVAKMEKIPGLTENGLCISGNLLKILSLPSNYTHKQVGEIKFSKSRSLTAFKITDILISAPQESAA